VQAFGKSYLKSGYSMNELTGYVLEKLFEGREFLLYRGRQTGKPSQVLVLVPAAEQPSPASLASRAQRNVKPG